MYAYTVSWGGEVDYSWYEYIPIVLRWLGVVKQLRKLTTVGDYVSYFNLFGERQECIESIMT